jgi:hypothetical protein
LIIAGLMLFGISRPFVFTPASAGAIRTLSADERALAPGLVSEGVTRWVPPVRQLNHRDRQLGYGLE